MSRLGVQAGWAASGNIAYAAAQWAMLIALAKLGSPELVGRFALALAVVTPVVMLTNLGLRPLHATDARGEIGTGTLLIVRVAGSLCAAFVIAGIVAVVGLERPLTQIVWLVVLMKGIEGLSDVCYGAAQRSDRMNRVAVSMVLRGLLGSAGFAAALWWTESLATALLAVAAAWAIVFLLIDFSYVGGLGARAQPTFAAVLTDVFGAARAEMTGSMLRSGSLMGATALLISLQPLLPRYFIEALVGTAELGIFAALAYVGAGLAIVVNSIGQAAMARLARTYTAGQQDGFLRIVSRLMQVGFGAALLVVAFAWWAGQWFLGRIYTTEYAAHGSLFVWLMVGSGLTFVASLLWYVLVSMRLLFAQWLVCVSSTAVLAIACVHLVPRAGLLGAAYALAAAAAIQATGNATVLVANLRQGASAASVPLPLPQARRDGA